MLSKNEEGELCSNASRLSSLLDIQLGNASSVVHVSHVCHEKDELREWIAFRNDPHYFTDARVSPTQQKTIFFPGQRWPN